MNQHEIALAKMNNEQLGEKEFNRILLQVAEMKRTAELISFFEDEYHLLCEDAAGFVSRHKLTISPHDIEYTFSENYLKERETALKSEKFLELVPESYFRFSQYMINKISLRNKLRKVCCNPDDEKVSRWRLRQMNRCNGAIGGTNLSLIHSMFCFEMAKGCSVGCDFCGLGAPKLSSVFRYNDENAKLFSDVLTVIKNRFGTAGTMGMLYYATEPLDNPDYEKFERDYYEIMGIIPQITTAAATRDVERTRRLIRELDTKKGLLHRFSVLNKAMATTIFESFSPVELLNVELIPQYADAPGFAGFSSSGYLVQNKKDSGSDDPGTISAIDGFCVNFCEKSLTLLTPVRSDANNPNGIHIFEKTEFNDGADFEKKLEYLIDTYMINELEDEDTVCLYDYFKLVKKDGCTELVSEYSTEIINLSAGNKDDSLKIIKKMTENTYTRGKMADIMFSEYGIRPEVTYNIIGQLWDKGFLAEKFLM